MNEASAITSLDWATFGASMAVLTATAVAAIAAWRSARSTKTAAEASMNAAQATERSAIAAEAAAAASLDAASSAERQASAMERAEIAESMPLVWVQRLSESHGQLTVQIGNSGRGTALNPIIWMYRGQVHGPEVPLRRPIEGDSVLAQEENLQDPLPDNAGETPWMIEARYQDAHAREYAVQVREFGTMDYYLIFREEGSTSGRFEPIIKAPHRR